MPLLEVDNIHTYYGESQVLYDMGLQMEEGEIISLLGRNGAGKTTTVRSIMGLTPPRHGSVRFRGQDITGWKPERISQIGISAVPENRDIFPYLTVEENLRLGGLAHGSTTEKIKEVCEHFPRLGERLHQQGGQMSGGEQQMLAIGRAMMTAPELLIFDEPSEGLAPIIVENLTEIIRSISEEDGTSAIVIEQNVDVALELADRHYLIESGKNKYSGTTKDLTNNPSTMTKILGVSVSEKYQ